MADYPPTPAVALVTEAHDLFLGRAESLLNRSLEFVNQLTRFTTTPTSFNIDFDFEGELTPFVRPPAPTVNAGDYTLLPQETIARPEGFDAQTPDLPQQVAYDVVAPVLSFGPKPDLPNITMPTPPPRPALPVMPDEPDYMAAAPDPITLLSLNLPAMPEINLPEFTSQRPSLQPFNINENWSFEPEEYVSNLLDQINARVSTWLTGQEALPVAIEQALFGRGRDRTDRETSAEVAQIYDDYGARGFSAPTGLLAGRIDAARQKGQDRKAEFNRDTTLKSFDEALANMRLAVQSGIQLEGVMVNMHVEEQRLLLQSASFSRDTAIAILNARIAQFNAEMDGYRTDAQVLEIRIKAELSKLDEVRLRLEAEQLKGQLNEQTIRQFQAQWDVVKILADTYRTRVEAVKVQAEANMIPIEIFKAETQAFETLWSANAKQWDGYASSVQGELGKTTIHRNLVDAYATRTNAVVQHGGLALDRERLRIASHGQVLQQYDADLRRLDNLLRADTARLDAVSRRDTAMATIYRARADVEQAASAAADRTFELGLREAEAKVQAQVTTAQIRSGENIALQGLLLESMKSMANIMSQLAASIMSAVNYSASVGANDSYSRSRTVGWSGEAEDWNGSFV